MAKMVNGRRLTFEPPGQDEVDPADRVRFFIRTPRLHDRSKLTKAVQNEGGVMYSTAQLVVRAREVLDQGLVTLADDDRARLEAALEAIQAEHAGGEPATPAHNELYVEFERSLIEYDTRYRQMVADRTHYLNVLPGEAFRLFVSGWENVAPAYKRAADGVDPEVMMTLPLAGYISAVGWYIHEAFTPTEAEAKNSESPSGTDSARPVSQAAKTQRRKTPSATGTATAS